MKHIENTRLLSDLQDHNWSKNQFIRILLGPRQVGKTTAVLQFLKKSKLPYLYESADDPSRFGSLWLEELWNQAEKKNNSCLLVIDEIQKIPNWSEKIKKLWDRQKKEENTKIKLLLLGSSSLEIQRGLSESLAGRFQLFRAWHWNFSESKEGFALNQNEYLQFGGYPGAYEFIEEPKKWQQYFHDSIIESVIGKDILLNSTVKSPALFRQAFHIICSYPAQEISYTKLLGQLQDKGNTDLIRHYLNLFDGAYLIKTLSKYSEKKVLTKTSSPKIIPMCPALCFDPRKQNDSDWMGHVFEAAIGAMLISKYDQVYYWRDGNDEVDFVVVDGSHLLAIEVKSGRKKSQKGLLAFEKKFKNVKTIFIGREGLE